MTAKAKDPDGNCTATGLLGSAARAHPWKMYDIQDFGKVRLGGGYVSFDYPRLTSKVRRLDGSGLPSIPLSRLRLAVQRVLSRNFRSSEGLA